MATARISITLDVNLLARLRDRAEKEHRNVSNLIAHIVSETLKEMDHEA